MRDVVLLWWMPIAVLASAAVYMAWQYRRLGDSKPAAEYLFADRSTARQSLDSLVSSAGIGPNGQATRAQAELTARVIERLDRQHQDARRQSEASEKLNRSVRVLTVIGLVLAALQVWLAAYQTFWQVKVR